MDKKLIQAVSREISLSRIQEQALILHRLEGNCSHSNFKASTDYCMKLMKESGFQKVERIALKADGKTAHFDCIMPQAWDMKGRSWLRLEDPSIPEDQRMLADSDEDPFTAGIWGAPTPANGLDAEIVDMRSVDKAHPNLKGKFVLLDAETAGCYKFAAQHGAAGVIVSDSKCGDEYPDYCRWSNAKGYVGWYPVKGDRRIVIFSITPRRAAFLRERLARGPVKCHAVSQSRIYDGEIYTVTGVIPGQSKEEIAMVAHMYEPFVPDDATGGIIIMELCRALQSLIAKGKLPPLRKSLRIILSMEWYGFSEYYEHPDQCRKLLSVFSFDSVCHFVSKGFSELQLRLSSMLAPVFIDYLLPELFRKNLPGRIITTEKGTLSDDTFCADGELKIPALWTHVTDYRCHHNAGPCFMEANWDMAYDVARLMTALVGFLAVSDKSDAAALAVKIKRMALAALKEQIILTRAALGENKLSVYDAAGKIRHQAQQAAERLLSINRFWPGTVKKSDTAELTEIAKKAIAKIPVPAGRRPLFGAAAKAAKMIVKRLVPGPLCSLARIPHDERTSSTVLPVLLYMLLDGKRSLYDAVKLYEYEHDTVFSDQMIQTFMDHLRYLAKYGYVSILAE